MQLEQLEHIVACLKPLNFHALAPPSDAEQEVFRFYGIDLEDDFQDVSHHFGTVETTDFDIAVHCFKQPQARGTCYVVHGYFDHAGLYGHLARYLLDAKQNVVLLDLPGHGFSSGPRASINAFADYAAALETVVERSMEVFEGPAHFLGQSTGAAVIMQYLLERRHDNASAIGQVVLLAPLVRPVRWPLLNMLFKLVHRFTEKLPRTFSQNSHDKEFLKFLHTKDLLQYKSIPVQWLRAMNEWIKVFARLPESDISPLIIQGQEDQTVDWRYNLRRIKEKFPGAKIEYIKRGRHHLVNEAQDIREDMLNLIDVRFGS